jgi:hypothetical protein
VTQQLKEALHHIRPVTPPCKSSNLYTLTRRGDCLSFAAKARVSTTSEHHYIASFAAACKPLLDCWATNAAAANHYLHNARTQGEVPPRRVGH